MSSRGPVGPDATDDEREAAEYRENLKRTYGMDDEELDEHLETSYRYVPEPRTISWL